MQGLFAPWHILVVLVVALLVLGPHQLPQAGRRLAQAVGEFRRFRDTVRQETQGWLDDATEPLRDDGAQPPAIGSGESPSAGGEGDQSGVP